MTTSVNLTGYGPRRTLIFDGDESRYELWEVKFLAYMRLQKLHDVVIPAADEKEEPSEEKKASAFAEMVQCLDDRSLSLVIREAKNDGRKALRVLREHYQGKGKPRIIALYTELTSLQMGETETTTDYIIRAETAATSLKAAGEVISDGLLVAMTLKGLPKSYKTFGTIVMQKDTPMTFAEFKVSLRNHEENEKCCHKDDDGNGDGVMSAANGSSKPKFQGKCFKCGRKGHRSVDCYSNKVADKWCQRCKNNSHNTKDCRKGNPDAAKSAIGQEQKLKRDNNSHSFLFTVKDQEGRGEPTPNQLLLDTGATSHIINDKSKFVDFDKKFDPSTHFIELADGSRANVVLGRGNAQVKLYDVNGNVQDVVLNNALYIPSYTQNIFSVPAAIDRGASITLDKDAKNLRAPNGTMFSIKQQGRLFYLNNISTQNNATTLMEWHKIMGHCNFNDLRKLQNVVEGMKIVDDRQCECTICTQGKMCQFRNRKPDEKAKEPLEFVHCDLAGPISPAAKDGFKYALSFIDDYTGINKVYFLKQKSDTVEATQKFLADTTPFGKIKRIRSDNGTEFTSKHFRSLLRENKIKHEMSAPYSPHQNGTVERGWRSLFDMARCLLLEANLPKTLWTYAVMASAYIRNRCFNSRLGMTPFEALTGKRPNLGNMHVFGSTCYAYVQNAKKLDARSKRGIFVGYDRESPAYLVYYPNANKVERVRCVKFHGQSISYTEIEEGEAFVPVLEQRVEDNTEQNTEQADQPNEEGNVTATNDNEPVTNGRYPTRTHNKPKHLEEYALEDDMKDNVYYTVDYCYRVENIPTTYDEAVDSPEANKWQKAMDDEMTALNDNDTYDLVTPPEGRKIVGGKWVYAVKNGPNGEETHKARYVAKGYSQVAEIDYQETFAPTARMSSVRMLMQRAVQNNMITHQMDVKTAYLNAPIDCDIYMEQPKGFEKGGTNGEKLVCKLKKSLYGLKQSGRNWNNMLHSFLCNENFSQSRADPCVYVRNSETEGCVILIIWVDDIIISATYAKLLESVKESLCQKFKMKDLGELSWFLGTQFKCSKTSIEMSQSQYIDKVLSKFQMSDCKPKPTPCALGIEKECDVKPKELSDPRLYRAIVGSLIYVMTGTRPDLCYVVTKLSQNMAKPSESDLILAKHVLRYLKGTREQCLKFEKSESPLKLIGFCDSDWGASVKDRRSITGYNFQLLERGPLISWKSRKQPTVALSTCEAEYISLASAVQESKFLRQICKDMNIVIDDVVIHVDNQGAINLAKNPVNHQRSKHIDIKYHFIRSEIQAGNVKLEYVPTEDNVADIFTKPATKVKLEKFKSFIMGN